MKLVIFDCDGTLVDSQHSIVAAMEDAFQSERLVMPPREAVVGVVGLSLSIAIARLVPDGRDDGLVARLAEAYKAAFAARRRRADDDPLFPGVREAVLGLAARDDVALGIATGKSQRGVAAVLERERLTSHFSTIQTADTHPSKPDPSMILAALAETGAQPSDTLMIGDTTYDIEMARAAGVGAVGVGWGYHPVEALSEAGAHALVRHSAELGGLLDAFLIASERTA